MDLHSIVSIVGLIALVVSVSTLIYAIWVHHAIQPEQVKKSIEKFKAAHPELPWDEQSDTK